MLGPDDIDRIRTLAVTVAEHDGESPLNEDATLALAADDPAVGHHLIDAAGTLLGYAQHNTRHGTAQLFVHPGHRRRGIGSTLLGEVGDAPVWAFGDLPAAQAFTAAHGRVERRRLLVMERPLDPPTGAAFDGVRAFRPATDAEQLLAVNAAAFDWHPEQRHFSRADLDARMAEDWYDPAGLLVTADAEGLTGFHWTKRHPGGRGEVYILATHPRAQGTGLGRRLLAAGLEHLAATGSSTVHLYVEASNARAVELYERAGFAVVHRDVLYATDDTRSSDDR
ncbi:MAG: mycothiol synthase [Micropruina sp.]|uniref:mycothiol synthase n=1 Tax=Micropruina sp. TaxID=2737536 RepID=UPI0039E47516